MAKAGGSTQTGPLRNRKYDLGGNREWYSEQPMNLVDPDYQVLSTDFNFPDGYESASNWSTNVIDGDGDSAESFGLASDELNGALAVVTNDKENDSYAVEQKNETWKLESGKYLWMEARLKIDDATQSDIFVGLVKTKATPNPRGATDRVGFESDDGDAKIDVISRKNSTSTKNDSGKTLSDDTYVKLGLLWDGGSKVKYFVDRDKIAELTSNVPGDENLGLAFEVLTGDANARTLTVDYLTCNKER